MSKTELTIEGKTYTNQSAPTDLLCILLRHLDSLKHRSASGKLASPDVLLLKSWLVAHADRMPPGQTALIQKASGTNPETFILEAAVGKQADGSTFIWHEPLPWPPGKH